MQLPRWLTQGVIAIACCLGLWSISAPIADANPVQTDHVRVRLISEVEQVQPGTPFWTALRFQIQAGWHIYWKNPGDSGLRTTIDWRLSEGVTADEITWPTPERLSAGPLLNFGYQGEVYLPVQLTPAATLSSAEPIQLQANADWLVCQIDCIPESAVLDLTLPVQAGAPTFDPQWRSALELTRQRLPEPSPWPVTARATDAVLTLRVAAPGLASGHLQSVAFFPEQDGVIVNAAPQEMAVDDQGISLEIQRGYRVDLDQVSGVLAFKESLDSGVVTRGVTIQAPVTAGAAIAPAARLSPALPLWRVLALAFLGGVILNLMPCVFPVLSLRALNLVQKAEKDRRQLRIEAIAFTIGILVSFTALAAALLGLRSLGQQIGWGFQLQSPWFVALMAYLMFAVGLSLSGFFVFGAALMGVGQGWAAQSGWRGEFFSGIFAVVAATPCTGPFMATAIGIALAQPSPLAIAIFQMMGLGLALPYGILSLMPGLQRLLPKPGAWMETFQQLLAFPLYGATVWLVWVLTLQTGPTGLAAVLSGLVLIGFAAWVQQKTQLGTRFRRRIGTGVALMVLGAALTLTQIPVSQPSGSPQAASASELTWEPYSAQRLHQLRVADSPVFVNFSAAWCVTCLVNEQAALNQPGVIAAFERHGVARLKADWTNRNPEIAQVLESFGRSGVPLYLAYPASAAAEPIVLPHLLTPNRVIQALEAL